MYGLQYTWYKGLLCMQTQLIPPPVHYNTHYRWCTVWGYLTQQMMSAMMT